jgi:hypothetical protein
MEKIEIWPAWRLPSCPSCFEHVYPGSTHCGNEIPADAPILPPVQDPMAFVWPNGTRSMFTHGDGKPLKFKPRPQYEQDPEKYELTISSVHEAHMTVADLLAATPEVPAHVLADVVEKISAYVGEHTDEPDYTPAWAKHIGQILDQMTPWRDR